MKTKMIGYWASTIIIALEFLAAGVTELLHGGVLLFAGEPVVQVMMYLGYPVYVLTILGWCKLLGVIALLVPRFPRLKEWAYAGAFFNMIGAAASWALRGDYVDALWPLFVAFLVIVSWALRPPNRTLGVLFPARTSVKADKTQPPNAPAKAHKGSPLPRLS